MSSAFPHLTCCDECFGVHAPMHGWRCPYPTVRPKQDTVAWPRSDQVQKGEDE